MGSLDAYLIAAGFLLFGQKVIVIRMVQSLLYGLTILFTYFIGKLAFQSPKAGLIAAFLLAIPTVNGTLYTTVSLGGYGEALLLGSLILWLTFSIQIDLQRSRSMGLKTLVFGYLMGFGLWVHGITLVFSIPAIGFLVYQIIAQSVPVRKTLHWLVIGVVGVGIGLFPVMLFVFQQGLGAVWGELFGSAVAVETGSWLVKIGDHLLSLVLFGVPVLLGMRPPWTTTLQQLWLMPFLLAFLCLIGFVLYHDLRARKMPAAGYLFISIFIVLFTAFATTSFGIDPSGRYFLPLLIPGALLAGYALARMMQEHRAWALLLVFWGVYQGTVTASLAVKFPFLTTQFYPPAIIDHRYDQALIKFLTDEDLSFGYSNYWVAYPLAFLSGEELIYVPKLPYHPDLRYTSRDNRYLSYEELVSASPQVSYIVTNNPVLEERLIAEFTKDEIDFAYKEIGDYHIYYQLSSVIHPSQLNLNP